MKHGKKFLAGLLALCLLCGISVTGAVAAPTELRYRDNGEFRILAFTDTHQTQADQPKMIAFMNEALDYAKPDLVVFVGDNVYGDACGTYETEMAAIKKILTPVAGRGIPFAFVWGNHDTEYHPDGKDARPELMEMYRSFPGCLAWAGDPAAPGASSYSLPIYSSADASEIVSNLWFFDSGHGTVEQSQIDWYIAASEDLQAQNGGQAVPSMAFQHIIVPEIFEAFPEIPFDIPFLTSTVQGVRRLRIPDYTKLTGLVMEPAGFSPTNDSGQLDAWAGRGDIFAAVFGHDHTNNFIAPFRGVDLVQIPGTTWDGSYGSDVVRGATLFILDENNPRGYEKRDITYRALAAQPGSGIGWPLRLAECYYWLCYGLEKALEAIVSPIRLLTK